METMQVTSDLHRWEDDGGKAQPEMPHRVTPAPDHGSAPAGRIRGATLPACDARPRLWCSSMAALVLVAFVHARRHLCPPRPWNNCLPAAGGRPSTGCRTAQDCPALQVESA